MQTLTNIELREYAKRNNVPLWMLAEHLGFSEPTMTRKLRRDLSPEDREKFLTAIDTIVSRKDT